MSVSSINSAGLSQVNWQSTVRQARQDFAQLFQAMQSGDLSNAQQAYSALQQLQPASTGSTSVASSGGSATDATAATAAASTAATSATATSAGSVAGDWSALGLALQSGNLTSAQSAFSQLEQDLQSKAQGAGHHHHHHEVDQAQGLYAAMQANNPAAPNGAASGAGGNAVTSDISALQQALKSGDTSSAQSLLAQLQNDLQASGQSVGYGHHHRHGFAIQNPMAAYGTVSTPVAATADASGAGTSTTA